jgi:hypothetical protein
MTEDSDRARLLQRAPHTSAVPQVFLSYSSDDSCEASLLAYAIESLLMDQRVRVWTY